jgi:hypothetical protein
MRKNKKHDRFINQSSKKHCIGNKYNTSILHFSTKMEYIALILQTCRNFHHFGIRMLSVSGAFLGDTITLFYRCEYSRKHVFI